MTFVKVLCLDLIHVTNLACKERRERVIVDTFFRHLTFDVRTLVISTVERNKLVLDLRQ